MAKKLVLKLNLHEEKKRQKAMAKVSGITGVTSVGIDKDMKLTVIGDIDAMEVTSKLRKICHAEMVTLGENKEEKKVDAPPPMAVRPCHYPPYPYVCPPVVCQEMNPDPCVIC